MPKLTYVRIDIAGMAMDKILVLLTLALLGCTEKAEPVVTVFAASSTTNAITDIAADFYENEHIQVKTSFASSSTLAKQIAAGAPADVFISANPKWMDFVMKERSVRAKNRRDLLGNRLVLIAPTKSNVNIDTVIGADLPTALEGGKLAMGDPDHVPAGIYGKLALENLGLWTTVAPQVARAWDVRACMALVERSEAPLGIVYATDAAISEKVRVVSGFPTESHPPIIYPVALVNATPSDESKSFIAYLKGDNAQTIFKRYGFRPL